ncbi:hypothetical protein GCM10023231_11470 [Olivibacter ginsenosidimutans]|uniref:Beta-galactosidase trimerisation domain-containing protein n=1 Tax=Olivibacter ginsenosidimutans TaxID=1176537 RepID=A0ABP9AU15_9SPHI
MQTKTTLLFLIACLAALGVARAQEKKEKTAFQTSSPWIPQIDVRSDIAIVYGANDHRDMTFEERVASWRKRGYITHFMTGIAWGQYQDYFLGKWDGKNHLSEGQVQQNGDTIWHGKYVPYIVPVKSYLEYMKTAVIKRVIDVGITSIYLEEPEFWARAGYSDAFKQEWQAYYGFPWRPQHESPENTYLSSKLKYQLYYRAIKEVSEYAKAYGKQKGLDVKVFIPTHSLVNYSSWKIVSPEASLASLPSIDGYIAQVWTGTSREPTYFNGAEKERVFENAFLEYGSMVSMTAPTGRKVFFLTDPIEDWPRDWADYKKNYQATFTAKLLYPMVNNYEVMPWPERIYTRPYKLANSDSAVLIPDYYATQMQVMVNALNNMPLSSNKVSGDNGIGVLMGNSLMFQRFPTHNGFDDPQFSNFYGQTLPLLKRGVPVQTVHLENLGYNQTLQHIQVLVMSYSNMKPMEPTVHEQLAQWVKKGGVLVYVGKDDDPYQGVMEWWNSNGNTYKTPAQHLFKLLGVKDPVKDSKMKVGKGTVYVVRQNPKDFVLQANQDKAYVQLMEQAFATANPGKTLTFKNNFYLERGPYDLVSVLDESVSEEPYVVKNRVIDLFDPKLPVLTGKVVNPGEQAFLYDLTRVENPTKPQVLASASRIYDEQVRSTSYQFISKSPVNTINSLRMWLPAKPKAVSLADTAGKAVEILEQSWDDASKTYYLRFKNDPDGTQVSVEL